MEIIKLSECRTAEWSGGRTTELLILPEGASIAGRDFDLRISTATVDVDRSEFTPFEGYERILCILEGSLQLEHDTGGEVKRLSLDELHFTTFSGDWKTTGVGRVKDFNVIMRKGKAATLRIARSGNYLFKDQCFVFPYAGEISVGESNLRSGDMALTRPGEEVTIAISGDSIALIVVIHG
jgi:uncharacterized protein